MFIVKDSTDKGKGIYASIAINKNEHLAKFEGLPISYEKTIELGDKESFALQISHKDYIYLNPPYRFFNHSCDPNCGLDPDLNLIAIKDIIETEELTYDYSTTMLEHHWSMECSCGSRKCRKVVKDFDALPIDLQKHYLNLNVVQRFIREYLELNRM